MHTPFLLLLPFSCNDKASEPGTLWGHWAEPSPLLPEPGPGDFQSTSSGNWFPSWRAWETPKQGHNLIGLKKKKKRHILTSGDSFWDKNEMFLGAHPSPKLPINVYVLANSSYIRLNFFLKLSSWPRSQNRSWGSSGQELGWWVFKSGWGLHLSTHLYSWKITEQAGGCKRVSGHLASHTIVRLKATVIYDICKTGLYISPWTTEKPWGREGGKMPGTVATVQGYVSRGVCSRGTQTPGSDRPSSSPGPPVY